ncbi:MAG: aminopeptidase P family protein [Rhodospirillaceae bacterium]|jgi:Xaa-Pro dipeptidase|nr:aminopeptidase P family protein [Rhodospirillaceae bacterium]
MEERDTALDGLFPEPEPAFEPAEYAARLERVRARMAADRIDCLFVSAPEGMYYLSGYRCAFMQGQNPKQWPPTSGIAVHVDHDRFILFDTDRETVMHRTYTAARDIRLFPPGRTRDGTAFIAQELAAEGWLAGTVGLEFWSHRPNRAISERFQGHLEAQGARVVDGSDVLREVRWLKSPAELARIRAAARIGCAGLRAAGTAIRPGAMELAVLGEAMAAMGRDGGEVPGVIPPVLSGPKTASPHALATDRRIGLDEPVVVDLAGVSGRYHANLARTWWTGPPPREAAEIAARAAESLAVLKETAKPGITADELGREMVRYYEEAALWGRRSWVGGYEMGIAFPPAWTGNYVFDPASEIGRDKVFEAGTAINYENQFHLPDKRGLFFMIETVLFDEDGVHLLSAEVPHTLERAG